MIDRDHHRAVDPVGTGVEVAGVQLVALAEVAEHGVRQLVRGALVGHDLEDQDLPTVAAVVIVMRTDAVLLAVADRVVAPQRPVLRPVAAGVVQGQLAAVRGVLLAVVRVCLLYTSPSPRD